jgi:serine/threonine-protein kinase RsbW
LVLDGNLKELARLTAETAQFCRLHALPEDVEFDVNLVLEELFVNGLQHGGCEGMKAAAEVELALVPDGVAIEYGDRGTQFDPTLVEAPGIVAATPGEPQIGGLGIHLVRQIARDFEYHRVNGWNRLRMRRPVPSEGK